MPEPPINIYRNQIAASIQAVRTKDIEPIEIDLSPSLDADGDPLKIFITRVPSEGSLRQIDGTPNGALISVGDEVIDAAKRVRFVPKLDSEGNQTFEFRATDSFGDSAVAEVTISVTDVAPAAPSPPDLLEEADSGPGFVTNADSDDLTHGIEPDTALLRFVVKNVQPGATVQLLRDGQQTGDSVRDENEDGDVTLEAPVGEQTGSFVFTAQQFDSNFNPSDASSGLSVAIDVMKPVATNIRLTQQQPSALPVPIVVDANPTVRFNLTEQIFADKDNRVRLQLFDDAMNLPLGSPRVESFQTGTQGTRSIEMPAPLGGLTGERTIRLEAIDTANNVQTFLFTIFVPDPGDPTPDAPNTPAFSTLFYLGATFTRAAAGSQKVIFVDREVPVGFVLNIDGASYDVDAAVVQPQGDFRLTLSRNLAKSFAIGQRTSWLRPWTQTFDKTTQTTWFTMEDGHRLGQFDPATATVRLFDVNFQGGTATTALDPHGVFFDFNTHLTPRVWFVYRNDSRDGDNPKPINEIARVAYLDLATGELVTFDFEELDLEGAHNIQLDDQGTVWMTAEDSNVLVELDFDFHADGSPTSSINSREGRVIIHRLPNELSGDRDFKIHGLQITVDQRTGERYVWFSDAEDNGSTGHIALLRPGQPATADERATNDRWYEWETDEALLLDGRLGETPDGHALFIAIDDRETPGIPEDDLVVFGDSGLPRDPQGAIRALDPSAVIRAMQQGDELPASSPIQSVRIPKLPGARPDNRYAATVQTAVDREGNVYFFDAGGGVGHFKPDDPQLESNTTAARIDAPFIRNIPPTPIEVAEISMTATAGALVPAGMTVATTMTALQNAELGNDQSSSTGVDQYQVAATSQRRGRNQGPFRGTLNAASITYGSLAESDSIATTVFAETVRRHMDVVIKPGAVTTGLTQGRIAFSVRRDGSLIATLRAEGSILDEQLNVSELLGGSNPGNSFLFDGEPNAVINNATGLVSVFGISETNNLVVYQFDGAANNWTNAGLTSAANWSQREVARPVGSLLIGEPTGFVDSTGQAGSFATTEDGDLLMYHPRFGFLNLTQGRTDKQEVLVYSSVTVVPERGFLFVYGTNQKGNLVEYVVPENVASNVDPNTIAARKLSFLTPGGQPDRELMVFQDVYATVTNQRHQVFAVDGNARPVHFEFSPLTLDQDGKPLVRTVTAENVTAAVQQNQQVFGYFPSEQSAATPFGGRVYTELAPVARADGTLFVYGTNGQDLIEFQKPAGGVWQVANLTNDIYSTSGAIGGPNRGEPGQPPAQRVSANAVFGAPTAYTLPNGERHILQINADGEVVEYYYQNVADSFPRFQTQNITLRLAPSGASDVYRTAPGQPLVVSAAGGVLANDRNPSKLTPSPGLEAFQVTAPPDGKVELNADGSFTYTPNAGFMGIDTFFYQARTNFGESPAIRVSIIVEPIVVGTIIDDGRPGYSQKGPWVSRADATSFEGDFRQNAAGTGKDVATWSFTRLPAGEYEVFTRWSPGATRASNAPYTIFDNSRVVGGRLVDQTLPAEGEMAAGFAWQSLGTVNIGSGTLKVTLTDKANGAVIADAVRVVRRSLETTLDDGMFGYSQRGSWKTRTSNAAVGGDFRESAKGTGKDVAEWKFTELPDGEYEVFTHWVAGTNRASNAPYSVFDNTSRLATSSVNQKVAPAGELFEGYRWHSLGTVNVTSGVLKVTLSDKANGLVIADAVRLAPASGGSALAFDSALLALLATPLKGRRR